jgi:tRNA nucleotidyltransferase (CCA-adding enzyme)
VAHVPVPGVHLTAQPQAAPDIPQPVQGLLERLWHAGHAGYVVGGSLRDVFLGRTPADWDLATDARPGRMLELFPGAAYENRFGTVAVRVGGELFEITTFRSEHEYADFRRPHRVEFGDSIELDLARRDFTVNAMAWGADGGAAQRPEPRLVDPFGGRADAAARVLRAVGDPIARFEEDALRMIRAVRLATVLGLTIEPATLEAIRSRAPLAAHLSGERVAAELARLLAAPRPSVGLDLLARTGLLPAVLPELAAQHGIAQNKVEGEDLWTHTMRTVDATPADRPVVRLAALLHDVGKPATRSSGGFPDHHTVGAAIAAAILARLRTPRSLTERVVHLVRHHMFSYESTWSDAAVRRFIARIGPEAIDELLTLRAADNAGSGQPDDGALEELRARVAQQLAADVALDLSDLAIDGRDLIEELGMTPGPALGRVLERLLERVVADPELNERPTLLLLAQSMLGDEA